MGILGSNLINIFMKKYVVFSLVAGLLVIGSFFYFRSSKTTTVDTQAVLQRTLTISKEYVSLRYRTDNILLNADSYTEYGAWRADFDAVIVGWEKLERDAITLESMADSIATGKVSLHLIKKTYAYTHQEITDIFDQAPAGKKIATLAKHLGTDAKTAYKVLRDQSSLEAEQWNKRGDTFQALESSATLIKDGCKVAGFVGTIALTGGTAALASGSALAKVAVIVSGADLTLEITDDAAKIALGNHNKISGIVGDIRVVTEPAAAILMISDLPKNLTKGIEKLNAVSFGLEQFNGAAQEGKMIGIKLPTPTLEKAQPAQATVMEVTEVDAWLKEQNIQNTKETVQEVEKILEPTVEPVAVAATSEVTPVASGTQNEASGQSLKEIPQVDAGPLVGIWEGVMKWTESAGESEKTDTFVIEFKVDGTLDAAQGNWSDYIWKNEGGSVRVYDPEDVSGYHEFALRGDKLIFIKIAGPDEEGTWSEVLSGSDFFGGRFMELELQKQ